MTTQLKVMVGAALAVAWFVKAVLLRRPRQLDEESGIRVKNGSVTISTLSLMGFQPDGSDWKTKKSANGSYDLTVVATPNTTWTGSNPLRDFRELTFTTANGEHGIKIKNGRFTTKLKKKWKLESSDRTLRHPDPGEKLLSMSAKAHGSGTLECTFGGTSEDSIEIDIR